MTKAVKLPTFADDLMSESVILRRYAWRRTGRADLADDLVQETMLRAWKHREHFVAGTNLRAWLFTILRNAHISYLRKARREQIGLDEGWENAIATPATQDHHWALVELTEALDDMTACDRDILVQVGLNGHSHKEIADRSDCALGTVRSRLSRARGRLRKLLDLGDPDTIRNAA